VFGTATFVHTKKELCDTFATLKKSTGEAPLVQQMVYGEEYGVEALVHQGTIFAMVSHHRIRSLSPTGGASVLKETLDDGDLKHTLEEYASTLIQKLKWSGPIMVEFKVDSDSLTPFLMEMNGRFWGSLPLSIAAGVDVPYLYYTYATGGEVPMETVRARDGIVTRHFLGDVRHLARTLFSRDKMRSLLYPHRLKALRDFFSLPKGTRSDVWSWRDPAPAFMEIIDVLKKKVWK
jgi:predicted ATP-grasp superfamily ATP-dependent carboligase